MDTDCDEIVAGLACDSVTDLTIDILLDELELLCDNYHEDSFISGIETHYEIHRILGVDYAREHNRR
jgi:hypothetical protein